MKITNRSYHRDYEALETLEAGISLTGAEVKMIREGGVRLDGAFIKIVGNEVNVMNMEIHPYKYAKNDEYDSKRIRKLLLHGKEIEHLKAKIQSSPSLTLVPISCYNKGGKIKLEIGLSRGRRELEKRKREKARDIALEEKREAKEYEKESY